MTHPRTPLSLALAVGAALVLTACSGVSSEMSSGGGGAQSEAVAGAAAAPAADGAKGGGGKQEAGAAPAAVVKQRIIRTSQVVVEVDGQLAPAAAKVRAIAQGLGGTVSSETTTFTDTAVPGAEGDGSATTESTGTGDGSRPAPGAGDTQSTKPPVVARPGQSVLVLRIPEDALDRAMTLVSGPGGVGKEVSRSATAQDVTGDLADLQSRVATQRASVERIRALLAKAGSLRDVVLLESEVTKREAELEALQARQAALADRADLATFTVDLRTPAAAAAVRAEDRNAFVAGLDEGWKALVASMTVVLTLVGALLPFAIIAAIVGVPVLVLMRRRRRPTVRTVPPPPAPTPSAGA
jgi:hypothetical protein